jgi:putative transposase
MVRKRYTEGQIIQVLREGEVGARAADLCRKYGISEATYYSWKAKYAGMTVSDVKRLKALEDENRRLKQIVAEQALDNKALKDLLAKNF